MCSVGDAFNVEITGDAKMCEYICRDCGKEFKGIGTKLRCPACRSLNTEPK